MKKSQIFAVRSEVCCELESNLRWVCDTINECKKSLSESNPEAQDYYSTELEKAQFKAKLYKELLDKIETIKAD